MDPVRKPDATVDFRDAEGVVRGLMDLHGDAGTLAELPDDRREIDLGGIGSGGVIHVSLERVQLLEGRRYDYVLRELSPGWHLAAGQDACLRPHRADPARGQLEPGTHTGLIGLRLAGPCDGESARAWVEVQSAKAGSLRHYVTMVEDIAERCAELLLQISSPAQAQFETTGEADARTLAQRFFFLEALLGRRSFQEAVERVVRSPHTRSAEVIVERRLSRGGAVLGPSELRQIASRRPRRGLPERHPLRLRLERLPEAVTSLEHSVSADIPENRFVKHALRSFVMALEDIAAGLRRGGQGGDGGGSEPVARRAEALAATLGEHLSHSLFRQLSEPTVLPLGSPVLQRREGYREILQAWIQIDLAARLVWRGGEEVFGAGKRDVAKLYEFWLCFRMVEVMGRVFRMAPQPGRLIEPTADGLGLTLASGRALDWTGHYPRDGAAALCVRFAFNRVFAGPGASAAADCAHGGVTDYHEGRAGAWTAPMRPDYTVTLWPAELGASGEAEAERRERIVHLHFDAKYRVQAVAASAGSAAAVLDLFRDTGGTALPPAGETDEVAEAAGLGGAGVDAIEEQRQAEAAGRRSKRDDLLKMHAYRDAIRRSEGAYVLYPGTRERRWAAYHELLPGIGAFPVCPGSGRDMEAVEDFLRQAAGLCVDRFSQLQRRRYWTGEIMAEAPAGCDGWAPEGLQTPPRDTTVIQAYIRREAVAACEELGVFYFHAVRPDGGTVPLEARVLTAPYVVPYSTAGTGAGTGWLGWWAEVASVRLIRAADLAARLGGRVALQSAGAVGYYYLAEFRRDADGVACRPFGKGYPAPTRPPPARPGRPRCLTWEALWGAFRDG